MPGKKTPSLTTGAPTTSHGAVLRIAAPIVLANIATPLLGVVDTAVVAQSGDPRQIGAIALGALVFSTLFWIFGFLRMGSTGLTAQAYGASDWDSLRAIPGQALLLAGVLGCALIVLQQPLARVSLSLLGASPSVTALTHEYFAIRIWSAPATLAGYAVLGWFIGLGRSSMVLFLQVFLNLINIILDVLFVIGLGWGVAGVAAGTVIAEVATAFAGLYAMHRFLAGKPGAMNMQMLFSWTRFRRMAAISRDLMIRTLGLLFAFWWFISQGARSGDAILAVNAVLMHFVTISAWLLDGFAFATETLTGQSIGARDVHVLGRAVRRSTFQAVFAALCLAVLFAITGPWLTDVLSADALTRSLAREYLPWVVIMPLVGVWCYQLDGIFIGATETVIMRNVTVIPLVAFLVAWALLTPAFGNHGLWASLMVFLIARAFSLWPFYPAVRRRAMG